jgi:putative pyruvate formate lyase activating enzyme
MVWEVARDGTKVAVLGVPATMRHSDWEPAYGSLGEHEVGRRAAALREMYERCRLCPRRCGANRTKGEKGVCRSSSTARVAAWHPHFGEERPLSGRGGGSGTIFFSRCNLLCEYCQNWEISHADAGEQVSEEQLAGIMLSLQEKGCHNINLVTPTHVVPNIAGAVRIAMLRGLRLPLIYNTCGYESVETLRLLDGLVDIYLPDYKYTDGAVAARHCKGAAKYPEVCAEAILEMHRQVGHLVVDEYGIALRGVMIRHLVLPGNLAGTDRFVKWAAERLGPEIYVNIMAQYLPPHRASRHWEFNRRLTPREFAQALAWAREAGLVNLDAG